MTSLPVLALPDFSSTFNVTTDASTVAVGAVLSQHGHQLAFFSKKLGPRMAAASTYVRELYAITEAVKKWRQYLLGRPFRIFTDHKSIKDLVTQSVQTPEQHKWLSKLFTYEIFYKPGKENLVADALSRVPVVGQCLQFSVCQPQSAVIDHLRYFFSNHPDGRMLLAARGSVPDYAVHDGLLYFRQLLVIPQASGVIPLLLAEFHSSPLEGHSGTKATLARLAASFYWASMTKDVKAYVQSCTICQQHKYSTQLPYGLLQPLPTPDKFGDISMDFITHLPSSNGKTVIWVVVDRLTKFAHFLALPTGFTAVTLASLFLQEIYRLHERHVSLVIAFFS
ncbi:UNVERIFIED_CONTAM: Retrovirus-related Pol polyprotein from transposon.6 [Sesamum radiatum]|uniref:Retrovirus-related Pol polyprotein from transposon.6 n=1 Tax=Sesamum radiatum TaxID=300843 RepID=A0AAW2QGD3_SESRA